MRISAETKIASIVKENPLALEAIISISKRFEKLRNPYLYRLMAKRASISMACKIAGCKPKDFFEKLSPLGFEGVDNKSIDENISENKAIPDIANLKIVHLDVRPIIEKSQDPLHIILEKVNNLESNEVLEICNTFLPVPLINLLSKKGFIHEIVTHEDEYVLVRFFRNETKVTIDPTEENYYSKDWDEYYEKYRDKWTIIDVRDMQMPMPMMTILEALEELPPGKALFIRHKKVPLFLIPELEERKVELKINRLNEQELNLILFHKEDGI